MPASRSVWTRLGFPWWPALLTIAIGLPTLWVRDLWPVDEPRYAEVAREMAARGDFLLPHLNGEVYTHKPPLLFWLADLLAPLLGGMNAFPTRIVALAAAAAAVVFTGALARRLYGSRSGILAAVVLALMPLFTVFSHLGMFDTLLAACVTAAWYGIAVGETAAPGERLFGLAAPTGSALLTGIGLGLGVLAKGPMALALVVPAAIVAPLAAAGWTWRSLRPTRRLAIAAAVCLAIVLAWFAPAVIRGGSSYLADTLGKQTVGRAVGGWAHRRPFWFYAALLPIAAFPWVFALKAAARRVSRGDPGDRLIVAWLGGGFVILSAIAGKQIHYLVPILPPLAILVGRSLASEDLSRAATTAFLAVASAIAAVLLFTPALPEGLGERFGLEPQFLEAFRDEPRLLCALSEAGAALALSILALLLVRRILPSVPRFSLALAAMAAFMLATALLAYPAWDSILSGKAFGAAIRRFVSDPAELAVFRTADNGSIDYFSGLCPLVTVREIENMALLLQEPGGPIRFLVCAEDQRPRLEETSGHWLLPVLRGWNDLEIVTLYRVERDRPGATKSDR